MVSRGYRGKRKVEPLIVSDGKKILVSSRESGDEPYSHALNLKVPVIVGKDRYKACRLAKETFDVDTIILDDGFQHRKLARDWDVVLLMQQILSAGKHFFQKELFVKVFTLQQKEHQNL